MEIFITPFQNENILRSAICVQVGKEILILSTHLSPGNKLIHFIIPIYNYFNNLDRLIASLYSINYK